MGDAVAGRGNARQIMPKEWASLPMAEPLVLTMALQRKDWERISVEYSLMSDEPIGRIEGLT